jgi:hypothetical protein
LGATKTTLTGGHTEIPPQVGLSFNDRDSTGVKHPARMEHGGRMKRNAISPEPDFAIDDAFLDIITNTLLAAVEETVQERVDRELLLMIKGEGFATRIAALIYDRFEVMVTEVAIQTSGAGPGRGHRGRSHKKVSMSLPEPLFHKVRELKGFMSCHVACALELYLSLQKRSEQKPL